MIYNYMQTKNILNFDGLYLITDTGLVIANERKVNMPNGGFKTIKQHFPKLSENKKGYLKVMLTDFLGNRKGYFVHRLVASAFIGDSELLVNHKDKNKKNNNLSNLEYINNRDNCIHAIDKSKTTSKYTGVTFKKGKWQAQKMINGKATYLGVFENELDAHLKYLES